ncbi:MAG: DUF6268 family outer membrane beta-barrel protein [Flavitalea sp.]
MKYCLIILLLNSTELFSQPYIDLLNLRYVNSPGSIKIPNEENQALQYFNVSTNIPIQFKKSSLIIMASPFFDNWKLPSNYNDPKNRNFYSIALPVTFIIKLNDKWSALPTFIIRNNDTNVGVNNIQTGGAMILQKKVKENLSYRFGVYMNSEFFGFFIVPVAGIQWKINDRSDLFGLLPGSITYQYKLTSKTATGASFRALTNSYAAGNNYYRFDENQLGIYLDQYLSKRIVLNAETGHSILRKVRTGIRNEKGHELSVNDAFYFKVSMGYRIKLD